MTQIFGNFLENLPNSPEYLIIGFSPSSVPLKQRWRNNGLSADFLADYLTTFFPNSKENSSDTGQQIEVKSAVSYIANELLENAMKFNDENADYPISIALHLRNDKLIFQISNSVPNEVLDSFQAYVRELTTSDPQDLYIRQLERNALEEGETSSRLGYLTMMNDYRAQLGWKFETIQEDPVVVVVTTMVQLAI